MAKYDIIHPMIAETFARDAVTGGVVLSSHLPEQGLRRFIDVLDPENDVTVQAWVDLIQSDPHDFLDPPDTIDEARDFFSQAVGYMVYDGHESASDQPEPSRREAVSAEVLRPTPIATVSIHHGDDPVYRQLGFGSMMRYAVVKPDYRSQSPLLYMIRYALTHVSPYVRYPMGGGFLEGNANTEKLIRFLGRFGFMEVPSPEDFEEIHGRGARFVRLDEPR